MRPRLAALAAFASLSSIGFAAPGYSIRTIDTDPNLSTYLVGIKDNGRTVGYQITLDGPNPKIFTEAGGSITFIQPCDSHGCSPWATALGVNNYTEIVGFARDFVKLFVYKDGATRFITGPSGATNLGFRTITDGGSSLIDYWDANNRLKMFIDQGGQIIPLALPLSGVKATTGVDIANNGNIIGTYQDSAYKTHAFLLDGHGGFHNIDMPGGLTTEPIGISTDGQNYVGAHYLADGNPVAFVSIKGRITTLQVPFTDGVTPNSTLPRAVNNSGDVAGYYLDGSEAPRGFAYRGGKYYQLPLHSTPAKINKAGQIVGSYAPGSCHYLGPCRYVGFIATPTG